MRDTPFDPDRHLDAGLAALGLTIAPEWRPAALAHLIAIEKAAGLVMAAELDDAVLPAPLFVA